ncbi:hypothetical protein HK096_004582 [Nowakowskiella sp. JEL0078]|nr:hypothetical protein HK096_004582 [Nowakowskiella sp. JEL0078]
MSDSGSRSRSGSLAPAPGSAAQDRPQRIRDQLAFRGKVAISNLSYPSGPGSTGSGRDSPSEIGSSSRPNSVLVFDDVKSPVSLDSILTEPTKDLDDSLARAIIRGTRSPASSPNLAAIPLPKAEKGRDRSSVRASLPPLRRQEDIMESPRIRDRAKSVSVNFDREFTINEKVVFHNI